MERFNLNTWLEDKSRKIVTRDGKKARIICYDVKLGKDDCYVPIIALVDKGEEFGEMSFYYSEDGSFLRNPNQTHNLDLFFADEEEELTELQKTLEEDCDYYVKLYNDGNTREELREWIKCWCHRIIDLARKELEKSKDCLAWLEKQGEQKPTNIEPKFKVGDSIRYKNSGAIFTIKSVFSDHYSLTNNEGLLYFMFQDKYELVEQKPAWSEEDENMWLQVINEIEAIKSNSSTIFEKNIAQDKIDWLNSIKDRVQPQQKQEWSEEDEKKRNGLVKGLEDRMGFGWANQPFTREEYIEWLKSLKDRVQPQPKQEWSEEDKSMYIRTLGILGKCYMGELPTEVEEELKWFKSITDKAQTQTNQYDKGYEDGYSAAKYNQWKPKKEELEALRKRTYFCEGIDANLDSLYTNLLKL